MKYIIEILFLSVLAKLLLTGGTTPEAVVGSILALALCAKHLHPILVPPKEKSVDELVADLRKELKEELHKEIAEAKEVSDATNISIAKIRDELNAVKIGRMLR